MSYKQQSETERLWAEYEQGKHEAELLGCVKYALLLMLFIGIIAGLWVILR